MKYFFIFISFLLFSAALQAQMILEELSYVPSPSGSYNSLIVKGNTKINNLVSYTFDIQNYSSILNVNVAENSKLYINSLVVSHPKGSVVLKEDINDDGGGSIIVPVPSGPAVRGGEQKGGDRTKLNYIPVSINGGNFSVSKIQSANDDSYVSINSFSFSDSKATSPNFHLYTDDVMSINNVDLNARNLYIFGMQIPKCPYNYYWQRVKVGGATYTVLACRTNNNCSNYQGEEVCIQEGGTWSNATCTCEASHH